MHLSMRLYPLVALLVLWSACGHAPTASWPELGVLDEAVEAFDQVRAASSESAALAPALEKVFTAADALARAPIPASLPNRGQLERGLQDLRSLVSDLRAATESPAYAALHPLVEQLLHDAGIPHVH
jgi:hypothetical protein